MAAKDLITVIIINGHGNKEWLNEAVASVENQSYGIDNIELIVEENTDHSRSIGKVWNEAVAKAKGKYCFFLGDDDFIQHTYIESLYDGLINAQKENDKIKACTGYLTRFWGGGDGEVISTKKEDAYVTGMVEREYLLTHKYDEERVNRVDTKWFEDNKFVVTLVYWHHGYYYRGHDKEVSKCGKINKAYKNVFIAQFKHFIREYIGNFEESILIPWGDHLLEYNAEMVFCDFLSNDAVNLSKRTDIPNVKKVLRVHGYEAYTNLVEQVNWDRFDKVIFTSYHKKRYVETKLSRTIKHAEVIPLGVDLNKFTIPAEKPKNNKIAIVGYINSKKGIVMVKLLAKTFPNYEFHLAGDFQQENLRHYLSEKTFSNIYLHGWQNDVNSWLKDKTYIMSLSMTESQQMSVLEAMAAGCKPLVFEHWIGSNDIYDKSHLWGTIDELKKLLEEDTKHVEYRKYVQDNYSQKECFEKMNKYIGVNNE